MPKVPLPSAATLAATEAPDQAAVSSIINAQRPAPSIYSNVITLKVSATDFGILFSQDMPSTMPHRVTIQELVLVNMSHGTMKLLSEHLSMVVKEVESILGPIKVAAANRPTDELKEALIAPLRATKIEE